MYMYMYCSYMTLHMCHLQKEFMRKRAEVASQQDPMIASSKYGAWCPIEPIIRSVSGQAKLTRNLSKLPLKMSDGPRINLEVQLEEIPIVVSDKQYSLLVALLSMLRMKARAIKLRKWWKDEKGGKKRARKLWNFALGVTLGSIRERNVRHSINFASERCRQNVAYVRGYMRHLTEVSYICIWYHNNNSNNNYSNDNNYSCINNK